MHQQKVQYFLIWQKVNKIMQRKYIYWYTTELYASMGPIDFPETLTNIFILLYFRVTLSLILYESLAVAIWTLFIVRKKTNINYYHMRSVKIIYRRKPNKLTFVSGRKLLFWSYSTSLFLFLSNYKVFLC